MPNVAALLFFSSSRKPVLTAITLAELLPTEPEHRADGMSPAPIDFYPNCFHQLTNPSFRNSRLFTSIQNPGGYPPRTHIFYFRVPDLCFLLSFHAFPDS